MHSDTLPLADLAQQVADLSALHEMSKRLLRAPTLREQFQLVLDTAIDFCGSSQGLISLYDPEQGGLVTQASRGISQRGLEQLRCIAAGAGACGLAFLERRRVIVADTQSDAIYAHYRGFALQEGIGAVCSTPFFSSSGEPLGVLSVYFALARPPGERALGLIDICTGHLALYLDRHQADQKMHREQSRSHQILNSMKDGFVLMDGEFRVIQINAAGLEMDGRPREQILGKTHWEAWPGSQTTRLGLIYQQVMQDRQTRSFENRFDNLGTQNWYDVLVYPEGEGIAVLYRDITEKKRQEQQLSELIDDSERKRRLYETFLDNSPDLAYVFDLNHRFVYANQVLLQMWDKTWDEAIGKNCLELGYEAWHAEMHDREIELAVATKKPVRGEVPFNGSFGRRIYDYIFVPVIGPDGEVEAIAGTTRDVTDRKQIEESLREANRRKDEFLAMLAHELRNPLAPISAAAELLKMAGEDKAKLALSSEIISRQVRHMTSLVDDLLDVSRVTRGLAELERRPVDIEKVINSAIEQARPLIESRQHTLSTRIPFRKTAVCGDKVRLVQVVCNLLNNAAKYTPPGGEITLDVQADPNWVRISVTDNGIGMEASLLPRVFELFSQAERSSDRSQGGLGLGLALAKTIVELHDGQILARSEGPGYGSCFVVELPVMKTADIALADAAREALPAPAQKSLRLMIVDDNEDAAGSLAALMQIEGHEVTVRTDPRAALLCASHQAPQVCILDIGLPTMNGHDLARELRQLPGTRDAVLIALTGYGQASDRALAEAAGFNHYFVKPVDLSLLAQVLRQL